MFRRPVPTPSPSTATVVRRRPGLDFSVTGVVYIAMMLFMGLAAINSQANLLFGVFGLMIGTLLVSGIISRLVLKKLELTRVLPAMGTVGQSINILYRVTNRKRFWPSLSVVIAELDGAEGFTRQPQAYMLHAAAGMTASVPVPVVPKRRGLYELNRYQLGTSFPFGFIKRARTESRKDVLLIYPPLAQVHPKLLAQCRSADSFGESMRPRPGGADEFYGLKEYRAGDNPRRIYWRRSARNGVLVTKEMTQVSPPRIVLLVDTHLITPDSHAGIERGIAMAASLAATALDQGLAVGLCVWSGRWVTVLPTRGKRHRDELLSLLATLPANTSHDLGELLEECQPVLRPGSTPVVFTPRDVQMGVLDGRRGRMLVIPADSSRADTWFRFDPLVDFAACMPFDQRPTPPGPNPPKPRKVSAWRRIGRRKAAPAAAP